jgi:hypothetical protein
MPILHQLPAPDSDTPSVPVATVIVPDALKVLRHEKEPVNGAVMVFSQHATFLRSCIRRAPHVYESNVWACVGPSLLSSTAQQVYERRLQQAERSGQPTASPIFLEPPTQLRLLPPSAFYKYGWGSYDSLKKMYLHPISENHWQSFLQDDSVFAVHIWNAMLSKPFLRRPSPQSIGMRVINVVCGSSPHANATLECPPLSFQS